MTCDRSHGDLQTAGFTLIELLVSLALFALISLAGISLVETIVGVQQRTALRADRLAEIQRTLYLITADFEQLTQGPDRSGNSVTLMRGSAGGPYSVTYRFESGALHRSASGIDRIVLANLRAADWRFFNRGAWLTQSTTRADEDRPRAVEITLKLALGQSDGPIRKIVELPEAL